MNPAMLEGEVSARSTDTLAISGSPLPSFVEAFAYIFGIGTVLFILPFYWTGSLFFRGLEVVPWVVGYAGLSALFAWFATFQVSTLVMINPAGIQADWRGPFGGRSSQRAGWADLQEIKKVNGIVPIFSMRVRGSLAWIYLTAPQARAVLTHPMCQIKHWPVRVSRRLRLPPTD
jgi:hypothetical protein